MLHSTTKTLNHIHCDSIHNRQKLEKIYMSLNRIIKKDDMLTNLFGCEIKKFSGK